jgi:regulator of extracellular matrix RemA (YlzA/DUF370 family)
MTDTVDRRTLDQLPDESTITTLREEAADREVSIEATYSSADGPQKRMVVSPRGTVVILSDTSEATFNRSTAAADIAASLRE